jgi:hypothetical protein
VSDVVQFINRLRKVLDLEPLETRYHVTEREERRQKQLSKVGELGAPFVLNWNDAKATLEALEELKASAVRDNQGVCDLIARLDNHVRGALRRLG